MLFFMGVRIDDKKDPRASIVLFVFSQECVVVKIIQRYVLM